MTHVYSHLFSPAKLGKITLKNRLVRSATYIGLADEDGSVTEEYLEVYRRLARGGTGLIITGLAYPVEAGKLPYSIGVDNDDRIPGLKRIVEAVRECGDDCRIVMQIGHCGRQLPPEIERDTVAPSAITEPYTGRSPREITLEEIEEFIDACAAAIRRAQEAGFDGVQLHVAHGWLLSTFLSPHTNLRQDLYGGSTENRTRILLEIYRRAAKQVGNEYSIQVKMNAVDYVEEGLELNETLRMGRLLSEAGFSALEISSGMWATLLRKPEEIGWIPALIPESRLGITSRRKEAYHRSFTKAFKKYIKEASIILVGGLRSPDLMDEILREGDADFISLCRPLIREPEIPKLWQSGQKTTADCISCNNCITGRKRPRGIYCPQIED
ncbi:MAG: NADH:flavin oxidoreductase [Bacillota bacterium]